MQYALKGLGYLDLVECHPPLRLYTLNFNAILRAVRMKIYSDCGDKDGAFGK